MSGGPYPYTVWTRAAPPPTAHRTSRTEITQILIAYAVLTLDLTIILSGRGLINGGGSGALFAPLSVSIVLLAAGAALTGFLAHELAHKVVARSLGYWAEFRMWPMGLLLSLLTSIGGFLFAAPGATVVDGMSPSDTRGWGRVAIAGPTSNLLFALLFYSASLATVRLGGIVFGSLLFLALINTIFATFNLLPIGPLDGAKVLRWGAARWIPAFVISAAFLGISYSAFYFYGTPYLAW